MAKPRTLAKRIGARMQYGRNVPTDNHDLDNRRDLGYGFSDLAFMSRGGLIHLLLVVALIVFVVNLVSRRR